MSYDLAVFDKRKAPADTAGFISWYEKQTEWEDDLDYDAISHASLELQGVYHALRTIFPPMNGPYAPSDEELSNSPDLEGRLCDYCIGKDILYLSFSYSMADHAYPIVKRAAYFHGAGFFDASGESRPVFFDSPYPMRLEGEGIRTTAVSDFIQIKERLDEMTAMDHSYLYLTDQTESYIQVGGYGDAFTVEKRIYTDVTRYTHKKAGYLLSDNGDRESFVSIAGNKVKLKQHQILKKDAVEQLLLEFFQGTQTVDGIGWSEMDLI